MIFNKHIYKFLYFFFTIFNIKHEFLYKKYILSNNIQALKKIKEINIKDLIVLIPHCIQNFQCIFRITNNIDHCKRCAKCQVSQLIFLRNFYGLKIFVVTGGSLARRIVKENRSKFIIAIACERDLFHGIIDISQIPVIGIINNRPEGPCINTNFSINILRLILDSFHS